MTELTEEVIAFLSDGTRTAKLGYVAADGRPLVAPVGFIVEGNQLVFNTGKEGAKGRALSRGPRVVVCVDDQHPPFSFVQVQGIASTSEDPSDLLDTAGRGGSIAPSNRSSRRGATGTAERWRPSSNGVDHRSPPPSPSAA